MQVMSRNEEMLRITKLKLYVRILYITNSIALNCPLFGKYHNSFINPTLPLLCKNPGTIQLAQPVLTAV